MAEPPSSPAVGAPAPALHENVAGRERELRALADAVRRLVRVATNNTASRAQTADAAARIDALADALAPLVPADAPPRYALRGAPRAPHEFFPYDPVLGEYNPLALPVTVSWEPPRAVGRARFDTPYEGPPGCVHGAVLAGVFDQVLNVANLMSAVPGPTATLTLRYRRPTPLRADLVFEAWIASVEGRKVTTRGQVRHGETVTVEAEGLFIAIDTERIQRLAE